MAANSKIEWTQAKQIKPTDAQKCPDCGQPMLPKGVVKRPNEYDHAQGCPRAKRIPEVGR